MCNSLFVLLLNFVVSQPCNLCLAADGKSKLSP
jgi:hypothetical protein